MYALQLRRLRIATQRPAASCFVYSNTCWWVVRSCDRQLDRRGSTNRCACAKSSGSWTNSESTNSTDHHDVHINRFLHVGPSGDCWVSTALFAAKHLQPEYVKSLPLPSDVSAEVIICLLEADPKSAQRIYDEEVIPDDLIVRSRPVL